MFALKMIQQLVDAIYARMRVVSINVMNGFLFYFIFLFCFVLCYFILLSHVVKQMKRLKYCFFTISSSSVAHHKVVQKTSSTVKLCFSQQRFTLYNIYSDFIYNLSPSMAILFICKLFSLYLSITLFGIIYIFYRCMV